MSSRRRKRPYRGDTAAQAHRRWRSEQRCRPREGFGISGAYRQTILDLLPVSGRALELGIGTGLDLLYVTKQRLHVAWVGIDLSSAMLSLARKRFFPAATSLIRAEGHFLPFRDGVFHFVTQKLAVSPLEEVRRVLTRGGWYIDVTLGPDSWREVRRLFPASRDEWRILARKQRYTRHAERLRQLGFTEVSRREWHATEYYARLSEIVETLLYAPIIEDFHAAGDRRRLRPLLRHRTAKGLPVTDHPVLVTARRP